MKSFFEYDVYNHASKSYVKVGLQQTCTPYFKWINMKKYENNFIRVQIAGISLF